MYVFTHFYAHYLRTFPYSHPPTPQTYLSPVLIGLWVLLALEGHVGIPTGISACFFWVTFHKWSVCQKPQLIFLCIRCIQFTRLKFTTCVQFTRMKQAQGGSSWQFLLCTQWWDLLKKALELCSMAQSSITMPHPIMVQRYYCRSLLNPEVQRNKSPFLLFIECRRRHQPLLAASRLRLINMFAPRAFIGRMVAS